MADYHPLIARAVNGLDKNTGELRRALYERARSALVNQLRGVEPVLDESDITRERLALEEAIRKVEAEAAKRWRADEDALPEPPSPPSLRDQGLRDFRSTVAEAQSLGDAAAEANRSAHARFDAVPGEHPPQAGDSERDTAEHYFEPPDAEQFELQPEPQPPRAGEPAPPSEPPAPAVSRQPPAPAAAWQPPPVESYEDEDDGYARSPRAYG